MDSWKTKYLFPAMGMIPIDRSGGSKSQAALDGRRGGAAARRAVRHLPRGHPQPRRQAAQGAHRRRPPGARGRRARSSRSASSAPTRSSRPDAKAPKLLRVVLDHDRPADRARALRRSRPERHRALRSMIDEVMFEIRELTGQEYVDAYAGKATPSTEEREQARPVHVGEALDRATSRRRPTARARRRGELTGQPPQPPGGADGALVDLRAMTAPITITLPDGSAREYPAGTTAADVAASIGKRLAKAAVAADRRRRRGRPRPPAARRRPRWPSSPTTPRPGATCCATRRRT